MEITEAIKAMENQMDVVSLTSHYGLHSYRYQKSGFVSHFQKVCRLGKEDVLFDLGCGYGEVVCALAANYKEAQFYGIEIIESRVEVANKYARHLALDNVHFIAGDMLNVDFSIGNYFYIFNPLFDFQYPALLTKLHALSQQKTVFIIAESMSCNYFDALTWLTPISSFDVDLISRATIYKSS